MRLIIKKILMQGVWAGLGFTLLGCAGAENEMAGGNIQAINHTLSAINWLSVNGYRAHGGGGSSCCIMMPTKWRPGLKAIIEWEVDPDPFAKMPPLGTEEFKVEMAKAESSFQRHTVTVDIPAWSGTEACDLKVHFLTCKRVKVTTACAVYGRPNYPIKEPKQMAEPAECLR